MTGHATTLLGFAVAAAVIVACSRVALAQPTFAVSDDDAAWIAGTMPGGWRPSHAATPTERVSATHALRRASAWMAFFLGWLRVRDVDESTRMRAFDLDTFALELVGRRSLPAMLPRNVPRSQVFF